MKNFVTDGKKTISVFFEDRPKPGSIFKVFDENGRLYFYRKMSGQDRIKFNICKAGSFTTNFKLHTCEVLPITIHPLNVKLPPPQRNEMKPFVIKRNPGLGEGTPARNFFYKGIIETGPKFYRQIEPIQRFIILHEIGHFLYKDEWLADLYAAVNFINEGFNNSTALYALTDVLNCNVERNKERIKKLFKILHR